MTRKILDPSGGRRWRIRMSAGSDRLGARLPACCVTRSRGSTTTAARRREAASCRRKGRCSRSLPMAARRKASCWWGADGLRSTIRQQCLPQLGAALRRVRRLARAHPRGGVFQRRSTASLFNFMTFCLPAGRAVFGLIRSPDPTMIWGPGHRRYKTWSGNRPAERARRTHAPADR